MDWINSLLDKTGITGSNARALQFVIGVGIVVFSAIKYSNQNKALPIIGILFGGYLIIKTIE